MKIDRWLAGAVVCAAVLWAQDPQSNPPQDPQAQDQFANISPDNPPAQDPPSRVARLDQTQGPVSFQPATVSEWTEATLNYPITIGDHLYADENARAEMHIGSTAVRLGPKSGMSFLNLDDRTVQIRLDQGALIIRVKNLDGDDAYEVDTAQGAVSLLRVGEYRIDTDPDRNAMMVTVRTGDAEVTSNGGAFPVHPHQTAYFPADGRPAVQGENPNDSFDLYAMDLDRHEDRIEAPRYVSREMPGWQDLDANGTWSDDPGFGPVWRPRAVVTGWAPYRDGHWAWVEPWGWTWIDDASWGFAPFHYGRWAYVGGGWGWIPGPVITRPVYSPALVAFVGGRNFAGGSVGWFPLGPHEVFVPSYRVSQVYVNRVNITNVDMNEIRASHRTYVNQGVPGGMTAVRRDAFVSAQPVRRAMVEVPRDEVMRARVGGTAPAIAPERGSIIGRPAGGAMVAHPPAALMSRPVFAQHAPPPAPVPFAARQAALQANPGRPVDPRTVNQLRATAPVQQPAVRQAGPANAAPRPGFSGNPGAAPANTPRRFGNEGNNPQAIPSGITNPRPVTLPANNSPVPRPVTPTMESHPADVQPRPAPKVEMANPRPADRPADRPVTRPAERPAERPAARTVEKPAARKPEPKREEKREEKKEEKKKEEK